MKISTITSAFILLFTLSLMSCKSSDSKDSDKSVPFTIAENYFVRNDVTDHKPRVIETEEDFNNTFGMATTMGENGKPTSIDFDSEFVIAVLLPPTNKETNIKPVSLVKENKLVLTLSVETGNVEHSYTMQPCLILIVDKQYKSEVEFIGL